MLRTTVVSAILTIFASSTVFAEDIYVTLSGGWALQSSSTNEGSFTSDFTTGAGSADIPLGTPLPSGTDVGWETDFNNGYSFGLAVGRRYGAFRAEIELAYQRAGVNTHTDVSAAGLDLSAQDAAVLISGSEALGTDVQTLVADGQGSIKTWYGMINGFYDFDVDDRITPYLGVGVGVGFVDVDYSPSAVAIIDDSSTQFAYQVMGGLAYQLNDQTELFAGYRYRATMDAEQDVSLFPASLDIGNSASIVETGIRFSF